MKKLRVYHVLVLILLVTTLLLTGCGKKKSSPAAPGKPDLPPVDSSKPVIKFIIPDSYLDGGPEGGSGKIPAGKTIKFFFVTEADETFAVDDFLKWTTPAGGGELPFNIPDSLLGKEYYIFAVVVLEGDFDLQGKTWDDVYDAMINRKILFGEIEDEEDDAEYKLFTLTNGLTVAGFTFMGYNGPPIDRPSKPGAEEIQVGFYIPKVYFDLTDNEIKYPMLGGQVDIYIYPGEDENAIEGNAVLLRGTVYKDLGAIIFRNIKEMELPYGQGKYKVCALIHVVEDPELMDIRGKNFNQNVLPAIQTGKVLFGKGIGEEEEELIEIEDGTIISLEFIGIPK